jgi:hypothetical protein
VGLTPASYFLPDGMETFKSTCKSTYFRSSLFGGSFHPSINRSIFHQKLPTMAPMEPFRWPQTSKYCRMVVTDPNPSSPSRLCCNNGHSAAGPAPQYPLLVSIYCFVRPHNGAHEASPFSTSSTKCSSISSIIIRPSCFFLH